MLWAHDGAGIGNSIQKTGVMTAARGGFTHRIPAGSVRHPRPVLYRGTTGGASNRCPQCKIVVRSMCFDGLHRIFTVLNATTAHRIPTM